MASFLHLRKIAKTLPDSSGLCKTLFAGLPPPKTAKLLNNREHISPVLAELYSPPVSYRTDFKNTLIYTAYKILNGLEPSNICECL